MTVDTARYAQSLTAKPMKGMLTGPVTMLQWSFVRDDQPRAETALQIALAHARRSGGPGARRHTRDPDRRAGLTRRAAAQASRVAGVSRLGGACVPVDRVRRRGPTRRSTRTCATRSSATSSQAIAAIDADVITIETSRSQHGAARRFRRFRVPERDRPRRLRHPLAARARPRKKCSRCCAARPR